MPRMARVVRIDSPHHITQRGDNRARLFFDEGDRKYYLQILADYCGEYSIEVWAYCSTEDNVHLLLVPKKEESLAQGIGGADLVYSQYMSKKYGRSRRIWQSRLHSRVAEKDRYLWTLTRYIEGNPLRAGIVKNFTEYEWSSAKSNRLGKRGSILEYADWLRSMIAWHVNNSWSTGMAKKQN